MSNSRLVWPLLCILGGASLGLACADEDTGPADAGGAPSMGGTDDKGESGSATDAGGAASDPIAGCLPGHGQCNLGMIIACGETGTGQGTVSERCQSNADCVRGLYCETEGDMRGLCSVQCYPSVASTAAGCQVAASCRDFGFSACFGREVGACALTCGKDEDCPAGSGCMDKTAWTGSYGLDSKRMFEPVKVCSAL